MFQGWRDVLAIRDARVLLVASAVSLAGDAMAMVALVLRVHASGAGPYAVSGLLWCFALPVVLTMGVAGAVADRLDSRRVLVASGLVQAVAASGLALTTNLWATFVLVLVLQTAFAFGSPVWTTLLPHVVGEQGVGRLIALQQGLRAAAAPAGAGLGGVLVQWRGDAVVFVLDAASFLALVGAALALRTRRRGGGVQGARIEAARGWGALRVEGNGLRSVLPIDGLRALRGQPVLWVLVLALLPFVITLEAVNVVEVFLVRDVLGAGQAEYGLSEAVAGIAAIGGSLAAGSILAERSRVRAIIAALFGGAAAQVGQGLAPTFPSYLVGAGAVGLLLAVGNACLFALLVTGLPEAERGRAITVVNGLARACTALALLLGGALATTVGPRRAYVSVGALGLVVATVATVTVARVRRAVGVMSTSVVVSPSAAQEEDEGHGEDGDQSAGPEQELRQQTSR